MNGLMMDRQLMISSILTFADRNFPEQEIVSFTADNPNHRYTYKDCFSRTRQLANVLSTLGAQFGDRIGTLAWNDYRHLELYYAISGSGMVCHTINPKLFPEQVAYIVNHAEDHILFVDILVWPLIEALQSHLSKVAHFVVMTTPEKMPETGIRNVHCYETLLSNEPDNFDWPEFDEKIASGMCYTSGTTGNPKGVVYSHRSTLLHAYAGALADATGPRSVDVVLPIVPMFHVNAWGIPFASLMVGTKMVMPGPKMADGETLQRLMTEESVTFASGVPTIWMGLLNYLDESGKEIPTVKRISTGGAACPLSIIERFKHDYNAMVIQGWGMTETSPLGTIFSTKAGMEDYTVDQVTELQSMQGRGIFGIEMKIVDENNNSLPWNGIDSGALKVRGAWVSSSYYGLSATPGDSDCPVDVEGWFDTGDVASINENGYLKITDRTKDVIKTGGEWVSSIEIENAAVGHPDIAEAAVIGRYHPKWTERPLLVVVKVTDSQTTDQEIIDYMKQKLHKLSVPDGVEFVDELPHTATGKLNKLALRKMFENYTFE
jgi:fatty-acyl-CoA synthase